MTIEILNDYRLKLIASAAEVEAAKEAIESDEANQNSVADFNLECEILQNLNDFGYYHARPEDFGALTSAPMVCDDTENPTRVWAFMDYQVASIPSEWARKGFAIFETSEVEVKA